MSSFPGSPRLLKGAIIGIDPLNPLASIILFQYNPETMTSSLEATTTSGGAAGGRSEPFRLQGAPVETITLDIEIDATDRLERAEATAVAMGISPQLSALEMLLYPKSIAVITNSILAAAGTIEVLAPEAPLTLFVWGPTRVLPVRLTGFTINELAYDVLLNPILAKVSLSLRVLSYNDLSVTHPGHAMFLAHQVIKETMAVIGSVGDLVSAATGAG